MSTNEPAEPVPNGIFASGKQAFFDLFRWKQRVTITNDYGETRTEWQSPAPLRNPISLFMQLGARDWLFFLVGFSAWTADAFDFHALSIQTTKLASYVSCSNVLSFQLGRAGCSVVTGLHPHTLKNCLITSLYSEQPIRSNG